MTSMDNTPDSPAKTPEGYTTQGGNFWTLITPETWKVLHAVLQYVEGHAEQRPPSVRQVSLLARRKNRGLRERIEEITQQRDHLASLLSEADATILELYDRIADLERQLPASNVLPLDPRGHKKL